MRTLHWSRHHLQRFRCNRSLVIGWSTALPAHVQHEACPVVYGGMYSGKCLLAYSQIWAFLMQHHALAGPLRRSATQAFFWMS